MKKQFYMLFVEGGGSPTYQHEEQSSAITEANRLCCQLEKPVYLLKAIGRIAPAPKTISENLLPVEDGDDLPF